MHVIVPCLGPCPDKRSTQPAWPTIKASCHSVECSFQRMISTDTIRARGVLRFCGSYAVEHPHRDDRESTPARRRSWSKWPTGGFVSTADNCMWDYVLVHPEANDCLPRLYGLPRANAAPLCLELHDQGQVELWPFGYNDQTVWHMSIQGIDGAGHTLQWIVRMADEASHIHKCFHTIRVRDIGSFRLVSSVSLASRYPALVVVGPASIPDGRSPTACMRPSPVSPCKASQARHTRCVGWHR